MGFHKRENSWEPNWWKLFCWYVPGRFKQLKQLLSFFLLSVPHEKIQVPQHRTTLLMTISVTFAKEQNFAPLFIYISILCFSIITWVCIITTMHSIYVWSVQKQWFHKSSLSRLRLWLLFYSDTFQVINTTCGTPNSQQQTIISLGYPLRVIIPLTDY